MTTDFCVWLRADPDDPRDWISLFVHSERAAEWCVENRVHPDDARDWNNNEARQFCDRARAAGFDVVSVS